MKSKNVYFKKMLWRNKNSCLYQAIDDKSQTINIIFRDQFPPVFPDDISYIVEGYFNKNQFESVYWCRKSEYIT